MRKKALLFLIFILNGLILVGAIAYAQQSSWAINRNAKRVVSETATIEDVNRGYNTYVTRIYDYQTGKILYVASTRISSSSSTIVVVDIPKK